LIADPDLGKLLGKKPLQKLGIKSEKPEVQFSPDQAGRYQLLLTIFLLPYFIELKVKTFRTYAFLDAD